MLQLTRSQLETVLPEQALGLRRYEVVHHRPAAGTLPTDGHLGSDILISKLSQLQIIFFSRIDCIDVEMLILLL